MPDVAEPASSRSVRRPAQPDDAPSGASACQYDCWSLCENSGGSAACRPHSRPCWWARPADRRSAPRPCARARTGRQRRQRRASAKRMPFLRPVAQDGGVQRLARQRDVGARRRRRGARPVIRHDGVVWVVAAAQEHADQRLGAGGRFMRRGRASAARAAGRGAAASAQARSRKARRPASACRVAVISAPYSGEAATSTMAARTRSRAARAGCRAAPSRSVAPSPH